MGDETAGQPGTGQPAGRQPATGQPAGKQPPRIELPEPRITGGMPLMDAIRERHSTRKYSSTPPSPQELSNILWVAYGLTREYAGTGIFTSGCRSVPAAHNWQEIDVYVALSEGLYLYDPMKHTLDGILSEDVRHLTAIPEQPFVLDVPTILIYVADLSRMHDADEFGLDVMPWADSAVMAENVYLYCASAGLATVVRAKFERPSLAAAVGLRPDQLITFSQPIGYPG